MKKTIIPKNQVPINLQSLDELDKNDSIYIYGAGECGKNVFAALKINGFVNVEGFIDTHKKGFCMGLKISDKSFVENPVTKQSILLIASMDSSNILIHIGNHKFKQNLSMPILFITNLRLKIIRTLYKLLLLFLKTSL